MLRDSCYEPSLEVPLDVVELIIDGLAKEDDMETLEDLLSCRQTLPFCFPAAHLCLHHTQLQ
jgi:hypothetical protein